MGVPDEKTDPPPASGADDDSPEVERGVRQRVEALIPDLVKKTFYAGLGALLSTEEGVRKIAKEAPKDAAAFLVNTAASGKDELLRIVSREVREFLQNVNLGEELAKILTTLSFEIKTEIRFIPNDEKLGTVKPDVKSRVRLKKSDKRHKRGEPTPGESAEPEDEPEE